MLQIKSHKDSYPTEKKNYDIERMEEYDDMEAFKKEKLVLKNYIACGTFGLVYEGRYDGQKVAVKVIGFGEDNNAASTFMQEVSIWNKLDHPNVAKFIGATKFVSNLNVRPRPGKSYKPESACCLVVEYLEGGTLASYLRHHNKLPFSAIIQFALDVARGLSYLHSKKIVHRDVKTDNMLLDSERRVKIIDFGISRFEASNASEMTGYTGTKGYMAPEVLSCGPYDHKCDVFSFGICLWEIYHCKRVETLTSLTPRIHDDCPKNLANLMRDCWEDPGRRPEMAEVVKILEEMATSKRKDQHKGCFIFFKR